MKHQHLVTGLLVVVTAMGCDGGTDTATDPQCEGIAPGDVLKLADANNYSFEGILDIKSYPLKALSDPVFDWSGLTEDLQGHALNPVTDIDQVSMIIFNGLTEQQVASGLSQDTLKQENIMFFVSNQPGDATSVHISELTFQGTPVYGTDYVFEPVKNTTWLLTLATGTQLTVGTRIAAFVRPDPNSTETQLDVANDSTVLTFDADLASLTALAAPAGSAGLTVDWENLTLNAQGNEFTPFEIDEVMVAHYISKTTADLETEFLDLELIADGLWKTEVEAGYTGDLSQLTGDGGAFAGIDETGVWILALRCTECSNPAPPFLTVLHSCAL